MSELEEKVENFRIYLQERDLVWQRKIEKAEQERDETKQVFRDYISSVQSGGKISAELSARIAALGI